MFSPIKNYETYGISENGEIKDLRTGKIKQPYLNKSGYKVINLCNENGYKNFLINRLVAIQFIDNPNDLPIVDHIDRDIFNNNVSNLRWVDTFGSAHNKGGFKNAKIKEKYICIEGDKRFRLCITRYNVKILDKSFMTNLYTLQDVVNYRDEFIKTFKKKFNM